ncbi:hypothetical protein LZ30DRAFT_268859 [Colletotrichum cereale]|nr:hypothetical protein LZ30DRAFT_268859 [Colletotrichum cereale]
MSHLLGPSRTTHMHAHLLLPVLLLPVSFRPHPTVANLHHYTYCPLLESLTCYIFDSSAPIDRCLLAFSSHHSRPHTLTLPILLSKFVTTHETHVDRPSSLFVSRPRGAHLPLLPRAVLSSVTDMNS